MIHEITHPLPRDAARDNPRISQDRDISGNPRDFEKHQDLHIKVLGFYPFSTIF